MGFCQRVTQPIEFKRFGRYSDRHRRAIQVRESRSTAPYIQIKTRTHTLKPPLMSTLLCLLCDYLLLICDIVCFFKEFVNRIAKNLVYFVTAVGGNMLYYIVR